MNNEEVKKELRTILGGFGVGTYGLGQTIERVKELLSQPTQGASPSELRAEFEMETGRYPKFLDLLKEEASNSVTLRYVEWLEQKLTTTNK